jgi:hypothetical protein
MEAPPALLALLPLEQPTAAALTRTAATAADHARTDINFTDHSGILGNTQELWGNVQFSPLTAPSFQRKGMPTLGHLRDMIGKHSAPWNALPFHGAESITINLLPPERRRDIIDGEPVT